MPSPYSEALTNHQHGSGAICQGMFSPCLPPRYSLAEAKVKKCSLAPGPHKVNGPTSNCCSRLGGVGKAGQSTAQASDHGVPQSPLPTPIQTRRRVQAFPPQLLGIQWQVTGLTPKTLTPHPYPHPPWPLRKAQAQKSKSKLTACSPNSL